MRLGVENGSIGSIETIDNNVFNVLLDNGKHISFDITKYNTVDHAYALTVHKSQGMTVQKVLCDMGTSTALYARNNFYVAISRAKTKSMVFTDDKKKFESQTINWAKKLAASDFVKEILTDLEETKQNHEKQQRLQKEASIVNDTVPSTFFYISPDTKDRLKAIEERNKKKPMPAMTPVEITNEQKVDTKSLKSKKDKKTKANKGKGFVR